MNTYLAPGTLGLAWGAAAAGFLYAYNFGKTTVQTLVNPQTGQRVVLKKSHALFFIPVGVLSWLGVAMALLITISTLMNPDQPKTPEQSEAKNAISKAESFIGSSSGMNEGDGNTKEAVEMAKEFSSLLTAIRSVSIEKGKGADAMRAYCQVSEYGVAFLVKVPSLRKFSKEAKNTICDAAWMIARTTVQDHGMDPKHLGVGVKGVLLYERAMLGVVPKETGKESADAKVVLGRMQDLHEANADRLQPFFLETPAAPAATSAKKKEIKQDPKPSADSTAPTAETPVKPSAKPTEKEAPTPQ